MLLSLSFFPFLSVLSFLPPAPPHLSLSLSDFSFRQVWLHSSGPGVPQLSDLRGAPAMCPLPCPCLTLLICTVGSVPVVRVFQAFPCLRRLLSIQQVLPQWELPDGMGTGIGIIGLQAPPAHPPPSFWLSITASSPLPAISPPEPPRRLIAASHRDIELFQSLLYPFLLCGEILREGGDTCGFC